MSTQEEYAKVLDMLKSVPRMDGDITMKSYEELLTNLRPIATKLKSNIFPEGQKYGHISLLTTDGEYASYIGDPLYRYKEPVPPSEYEIQNPITEAMTEPQRKAMETKTRRYEQEYNKFLATTEKLRDAIVEAVDEEHIEALKDPVVDYDMVAPYDLLGQIKSSILLTTVERKELKALVFTELDVSSTSIRAYANAIDAAWKTNERWNNTILEQDIVDHFVGEMYKSGLFDEKVMAMWEKRKDEADDEKTYKKSTAKNAGFGSMANVEEEPITDAMDESVNAVLEAMQANTEQMNAVAVTNAGLEQTVKEQSKQIIALIKMNENLVKALTAAGVKVAEEDKVKEEKKKTTTAREWRMCSFCKEKHKGGRGVFPIRLYRLGTSTGLSSLIIMTSRVKFTAYCSALVTTD
eukprot:scaffold36341_cov43-Cyclotella_meneghiniana.AAC.7